MRPEPTSGSAAGLRESTWRTLAGIGVGYFAACALQVWISRSAQIHSVIWPGGGIGLAALLLSPQRRWRAILLVLFEVGLAAKLLAGRTLLGAAETMAANVAESGACAWLITRWCGGGIDFHKVRDVLALATAATVVNAGTALVGAAPVVVNLGVAFWPMYQSWWIADGLGILLITPLIVTWARAPKTSAARRLSWSFELGIVTAVSLALSWAYFGRHQPGFWLVPHSYMLIVPLAWAAMRLGPQGVAAVLAVVAAAVLALTASGLSSFPLGGSNPVEHALWVQVYLGVSCAVALLLAAVNAEHESVEGSLRETEAGLRALGDNLPNGMVYQVLRDRDGARRFLYLSEGLRRLNGLAPEDVLRDASLLDRQIIEEERPAVLAARASSVKALGVFDVVVRLRRADGQLRRMRFCSAPRLLGDGRIVWDGIETDITEQVEAEEALRENRDRYRRLVEHIPIGITLSVEEKIEYANPEAARIFGAADSADYLGRSIFDFVPEAAREAVRKRRAAMIATGSVSPPLDAPIRRLDGSAINVETRGLTIQHEGKPAILNLFVDISDRKRADEALRQSESQLRALTSRLQSLREEERTSLAREIHDHLGQLLTALGLDLRLIERRLSGVGDEELRTSLQTKVASARVLTDETITSVQKIAAELRPAILDRLGLEAAIEAETQAFEARTGVRFQLSLPAQPCNASPRHTTALFRIFQEILTNVARHAKASHVAVRLSAGAEELVLAVQDDGVGIADADLANASSLGLLGMRERAQILGGHVSFGRNRDRGTAVTVSIPLNGTTPSASV